MILEIYNDVNRVYRDRVAQVWRLQNFTSHLLFSKLLNKERQTMSYKLSITFDLIYIKISVCIKPLLFTHENKLSLIKIPQDVI